MDSSPGGKPPLRSRRPNKSDGNVTTFSKRSDGGAVGQSQAMGRKKVNFGGGVPPEQRSSLSRTSRNAQAVSGSGGPTDVFSDNGRLKIPSSELISLVSSDKFVSSEFVARYMGQLSTTGFEAARQELEKVIHQVQNQILENSVTNNEIYVMLCDSVQGMESQLQRLHSVLASLRTLSGELRFLAGRDGGGGESTTVVGTTGATTTQGGETSKLNRQQAPTTGNDFEPPELAQIVPVWRTFVEHLDLAIAERKLHKHHRLLTAAGTVLDDILQQSVQKADIGSTLPLHLWIEQKEVYLESSRRTAISLCESTILEPGIARTDLQQNVRLLSKMSTPLHAVSCLLASHEQNMEHQVQMLRNHVGVGSNDFEFLGAVSQRVFGCIGRAANDLTLLFRKSAQELSSAFTVWALRLTERCVNILVADVLLPYALPMGLSAVMECVLQVMVYCSCLEDTHRVCMQPHLLRVLWPQIENAIELHVTSASERIRSAAMGDIAEMVTTRRCPFKGTAAPPSGGVLVSEVTFMVQELQCMDAIEVGKSMRNATISMFKSFCEGVERGIQQAAQQTRGGLPQILVSNGENIMMSLSYVMETSLPKATASCTQKLGVMCVSRKMEPELHKVASALGVEAVAE